MGVLTQETITDILKRLSEGESLRAACRANDVSESTVRSATLVDSELFAQYVRARDEGIDSQAEEMHDLEMRVLSGDLDPNAFRAAMDARKWRMARQAPRKYGDKIQQEITGKDGGSIKVETVSSVTKSKLDELLGR